MVDAFVLSQTEERASAGQMSTSRNRARSRFSARTIVQELQGAQDALIAFDGYGPEGPLPHATVLQRPAARHASTWLERVLQPWHQLRAALRLRG